MNSIMWHNIIKKDYKLFDFMKFIPKLSKILKFFDSDIL